MSNQEDEYCEKCGEKKSIEKLDDGRTAKVYNCTCWVIKDE